MKVVTLIDILEGAIAQEDWGWITIPAGAAREIAAILHALPNSTPGRPKGWTNSVECRATIGLLYERPITMLAREIAAMTGTPESSCRRRLQELKRSSRLKKLQAAKRKGEAFHAARRGEQR